MHFSLFFHTPLDLLFLFIPLVCDFHNIFPRDKDCMEFSSFNVSFPYYSSMLALAGHKFIWDSGDKINAMAWVYN